MHVECNWSLSSIPSPYAPLYPSKRVSTPSPRNVRLGSAAARSHTPACWPQLMSSHSLLTSTPVLLSGFCAPRDSLDLPLFFFYPCLPESITLLWFNHSPARHSVPCSSPPLSDCALNHCSGADSRYYQQPHLVGIPSQPSAPLSHLTLSLSLCLYSSQPLPCHSDHQ